MTDKEIVQAILNNYSSVLKTITGFGNNLERIKSFLEQQEMSAGVCWYAQSKLGIKVNYSDWINKSSNYSQGYSLYWCMKPGYATTAHEMIQCISYRVQKLQEVLNAM